MTTEYYESKVCEKFEKLNQPNYLRWVIRMRHHLTATQCLSIVLGDEPRPPPGHDARTTKVYQSWIEKDGRAMGTLLGACSQEMVIQVESPTTSADLWHRRLGHINYNYIKTLFPNERPGQPANARHICILSKQNRAAHRKTPANRATHPFLIHSDSCTISTPSISRARYYLLFIDDFTRWTFVYFLNKNADTCAHAFNEMIAYIRTQYSPYKSGGSDAIMALENMIINSSGRPSPITQSLLSPHLPTLRT